MYFVGSEFDPDAGSYKALQNAIKAAGKRNMKVFDADGTIVWPKVAEQLPEEDAVEQPEPEPEESTVEQPETEENITEQQEQKKNTVERPEVAHIIGRVEVVRQGLLAVRNAPSWEEGHKNGIVKTGHTVDVTECKVVDGKKLYHTVDGYWISGESENTKLLEE